MIEQAVEILKEHDALDQAQLEEKILHIIQKRPGHEQVNEILKSGYISGRLSATIPQEKIEIITEIFEKKEIEVDLNFQMPIGQVFGQYGTFPHLNQNKESNLKHKPGQVLVLYIWTSWCPPAHKVLSDAQDLFSKNSDKWKQKVRHLCISLDDDKKSAKKKIDLNRWYKLSHIIIEGWPSDHLFLKDFNIESVPTAIIVNKFGTVSFIGHPEDTNMLQKINQLIEEKESGPKIRSNLSKKQGESQNSKVELEKNEKEGKQFLDSISKTKVTQYFKDCELFVYRNVMTTTFAEGCFGYKGKIDAWVTDLNPDDLEKAKNFFKAPESLFELDVQKCEYRVIPSTEGAKCWACDSALEFPFYWLSWEDGDKFGCRKCVEAKGTEEGHHYKYEKNSLLMLGPWKAVPVKGMGKNLQPEDVKNGSKHGYVCNICKDGKDSQPGHGRYICMGCRADPNLKGDFADVCDLCLQKLIKGQKEALDAMKGDGHAVNHPFLRVLYNAKDYYNY